MGRSVFVCLFLKCGVCNVLFDFGLVHRINLGSFSAGLKVFGGWLGVGGWLYDPDEASSILCTKLESNFVLVQGGDPFCVRET